MNLRKVITEALIAKKVISDCNCGCKATEKCHKSPILNENIASHKILSEGLKYHIDNKKPLTENVYRAGSSEYFNLWAEARAMYVRGIIDAHGDDLEILTETSIGEFGIVDGKKVPLDFPIQENIDINRYELIELIRLIKTADNPRNLSIYYNSGRNVVNIGGVGYDKGELVQKFNSKPGQSLNIKTLFWKANKSAEEIVDKVNNMNAGVKAELKYGYGNEPFIVYKKVDALNEEKKKNPPLNKPKRGGSKAYYVYVRDPKTKKIKKVSFGSSGLKAKINNPKARQAFAKRHRCSEKNDKTKASYWSCRLPRYAKLLGLKSNFSGFW